MNDKHDPELTSLSQKLRREMTKEERRLWYDFLKEQPLPFHRQKIFGRYIADFYCASAQLIIELDGSQHYEEAGREYDRSRDDYFRGNGIAVLRYSNADVDHHFPEVCEDIRNHLITRCAGASPQGEAEKDAFSLMEKYRSCEAEELQKESAMKNIILYTDGACSGNPGPGGWAGSQSDPKYVPTRSPLRGNRSGMTRRRQPIEDQQ